MCRSLKLLRQLEPPATPADVEVVAGIAAATRTLPDNDD